MKIHKLVIFIPGMICFIIGFMLGLLWCAIGRGIDYAMRCDARWSIRK